MSYGAINKWSFSFPFNYSDAANNGCQPALLHYSEFYNSALDHVDLMQEYWRWQSPDRPGQFSYCQYPFMLSIVGKRIILTKVNASQTWIFIKRNKILYSQSMDGMICELTN